MRILGVETSCDETGLAIIEASGGSKTPRFSVLKNLVASQIKIHRPFGGVVPNLAKREHLKNLPVLWQKILNTESRTWKKTKKSSLNSKSKILNFIDLIAVTVGPGLEPALWTGINFAKELGKELKMKNVQCKIVGASHLEGHLYSFLLPPKKLNSRFHIPDSKKLFPAIALIVSGGHTILLKMDSFAKWRRLGETRDDAAGEAFDKVARMLSLPYPGGPEVEKLAKKGNPSAINFPRPMMHDKSYDFSFSGLKTAVLYHLRGQNSQINADSTQNYAEKIPRRSASSPRQSADAANIAASFQEAAIDVLAAKTMRAAREFGAKSVMLSGGVAANKALRERLRQETKNNGVKFFVPDFKYNLDNAAMIAVAGYMAYLRKKRYKLAAQGGLDI